MAKQKKRELKDKLYRLAGDLAPLSYNLKSGSKGNLLVWDEESGTNRAIRHCRNEKTIFIDEQSEHALVEPVIIEKGYLTVPARETITQDFLDIHPGNVANGGNVFEEVNEDKQAEEQIEREDLILDLKNAVREKQKDEEGIYELQALVATLKGSAAIASKMSSAELKREIYIAIENNPLRFSNGKGGHTLFDRAVKRKHLALLCIGSGVISTSPNGKAYVWADTGSVITNIPAGVKPTDHLFEFLETDEGILVLEEMQKKL